MLELKYTTGVKKTKVENMKNRVGKPVVNQLIINQIEGVIERTIFQ